MLERSAPPVDDLPERSGARILLLAIESRVRAMSLLIFFSGFIGVLVEGGALGSWGVRGGVRGRGWTGGFGPACSAGRERSNLSYVDSTVIKRSEYCAVLERRRGSCRRGLARPSLLCALSRWDRSRSGRRRCVIGDWDVVAMQVRRHMYITH